MEASGSRNCANFEEKNSKESIESLWEDIDDGVLSDIVLDKRSYEEQDNDSAAPPEVIQVSKKLKTTTRPLDLFSPGRGYLWVSSLTAQMWCEQKLHYSLTLPVVEVEKPAISKGTDLHLARELADHDVVKIKVTSNEDIWAAKLLNLYSPVISFLLGTKMRREIPIFGFPFSHNVFVIGLIDEIQFDPETFTFDILELKTRSSSRTLPSKAQSKSHSLQVMLYKKLFDDLVKGQITKYSVAQHLRLELDKNFGEDINNSITEHGLSCLNLSELMDCVFEKMKSLTCINQLLLEYCFQEDNSTIGITEVKYNEEWLKETCDHYMKYWKGERPVEGVDIEEAFKCQSCEFAEVCEWREKKSKELARKNSANSLK
ncbi:exonuclease V-like [Lingula anatina]|uniref:Exonuclease V n=1 Tax=Lingula anatina TaxID=7574 RepID=A0A1S3HQ42_LINAN|nr:exonuclease V [Lingula anatina]XP_013388157.1 exonuclease V-like [Lingula anatina]|eukprot:XP_013381053.1 exonuclease V [Lingula anatina]